MNLQSIGSRIADWRLERSIRPNPVADPMATLRVTPELPLGDGPEPGTVITRAEVALLQDEIHLARQRIERCEAEIQAAERNAHAMIAYQSPQPQDWAGDVRRHLDAGTLFRREEIAGLEVRISSLRALWCVAETYLPPIASPQDGVPRPMSEIKPMQLVRVCDRWIKVVSTEEKDGRVTLTLHGGSMLAAKASLPIWSSSAGPAFTEPAALRSPQAPPCPLPAYPRIAATARRVPDSPAAADEVVFGSPAAVARDADTPVYGEQDWSGSVDWAPAHATERRADQIEPDYEVRIKGLFQHVLGVGYADGVVFLRVPDGGGSVESSQFPDTMVWSRDLREQYEHQADLDKFHRIVSPAHVAEPPAADRAPSRWLTATVDAGGTVTGVQPLGGAT